MEFEQAFDIKINDADAAGIGIPLENLLNSFREKLMPKINLQLTITFRFFSFNSNFIFTGMKYLFLVQGEGRGHMTQAIELGGY
jgi:hypothetical protein